MAAATRETGVTPRRRHPARTAAHRDRRCKQTRQWSGPDGDRWPLCAVHRHPLSERAGRQVEWIAWRTGAWKREPETKTLQHSSDVQAMTQTKRAGCETTRHLRRSPAWLKRKQAKSLVRTGPFDAWSGWRDSNSRPLAPHASALPGCATPRSDGLYQRSRSSAC